MISDVKIDYSGLMAGMKLAEKFSTRTPAEACDNTALAIAVSAQRNTRFTEIPKIDTDLAVITMPVIGKRGKPIKGKKRFKGNVEVNPDVVLIIQARARPGSRYNELTKGRWALDKSPFKGVSRAEGRAAMAQLEHRMIAGRHSSTHFLQSGWNNSIKTLMPLVNRRYYRGGSAAVPLNRGLNLGHTNPAQSGGTFAECVISNLIGTQGILAEPMNEAVQKYVAPVAQEAVDREGIFQANYYLKKATQEEFILPVGKHWK